MSPWNTDIILKRKNVYLKNTNEDLTRKNVYPWNTDIILKRKNVYSKNTNEDLKRKNVSPWNTDIILKRQNVCLRNTSVRHTEQSEVSINISKLPKNGSFTSFRMTMKSRRNFFTSLRMDVD